jgi:hypothetical protein
MDIGCERPVPTRNVKQQPTISGNVQLLDCDEFIRMASFSPFVISEAVESIWSLLDLQPAIATACSLAPFQRNGRIKIRQHMTDRQGPAIG